MFKQIWLYDGTPILLESIQKYQLEDGTIVDDVPKDIEKEVEIDGETIIEYEQVPYEVITIFDYPKDYTEIMPKDGLYEPIRFDGEKWIGTPKEDWETANPPEESDKEPTPSTEIQNIVEELLLQMLELQMNLDSREV